MPTAERQHLQQLDVAVLLPTLPEMDGRATASLFAAIRCADLTAARQALADGADINSRGPSGGETPLMQVRLCSAPLPMLQLLLAAGADPGQLDLADRSALHHLSLCPQPTVIEVLLARGADPHLRDSFGQRPLDFCLSTASAAVVARLVAAMQPLDREDRTRLFNRYLQDGDTAAALQQLAAGIVLGPLSRGGIPPLAMAAQRGDARLVAALLDAGAEVDETFGAGETALLGAARQGHVDALHVLLARRANPLHCDRAQASALHLAAASRRAPAARLVEVVQALLAAGAAPLTRDHDGYWPRALARAQGNAELLPILPALPDEPAEDASARHVAAVELANSGSERLRWRPNDLVAPFALEQHIQRDEWHARWLDAEGLVLAVGGWLRQPELAWLLPLLQDLRRGQAIPCEQVLREYERAMQRAAKLQTFRAG